MTDLICRKTMTRCLTPGMCRPHGGCRPDSCTETVDSAWLAQLRREFVATGDELSQVKAERDQLKAENAGLRTGYQAYEDVSAGLKAEIEALRKEREGKVLVSVDPSEGLLMSMAIRSDHALGCPGYYDQKVLGRATNGVSHARMLECALGEMRKLHEEVVGTGFYSPEKDADYAAMAKEASHG